MTDHGFGRDLKSPWAIIAKGGLFVVVALLAGGVLVARDPQLLTVVLLLVVAWASARAYYFVFYVIEHWLDPEFRFSGLGSALAWLLRHGRR